MVISPLEIIHAIFLKAAEELGKAGVSAACKTAWKNALILLMGRLDTSSEELLTQWIAPAFQVDVLKSSECLDTSGLFPRLDR